MKHIFILPTAAGLSALSSGDGAAPMAIAPRGTEGLPMKQGAEAAAAGENGVILAARRRVSAWGSTLSPGDTEEGRE